MSTQTTELLRILMAPSEWFQMPRCILRNCSTQEAVLLTYLIDKSRMFRADEKDGWFYCTVRGATLEIGMTEDVQRRTVNKLKAKGWLESRQQGLPAKRFFCVNLTKVISDCTGIDLETPELGPAKTPELDSAKTPDHSIYKGEVFNKRKRGAPTRKTPVKKKKVAESKATIIKHKLKWIDTDKKYGARLRQIMIEQDTDLAHNPRITKDTYIENIYMVRTDRGRGQGKIQEVLEWYRRNYSDTYTPKLKFAFDFYSKFSSIEEAMHRKQEGRNTQSEEDREREAETDFEHHYFTAHPEHTHMLPKESNEICKQLGIPPRYRNEGGNVWSRIN